MPGNLTGREEIIYEGRRAMFVIEERVGVSKNEDMLREAELRRLAHVATAEERRARRERIRKRIQSFMAVFGIGHL